MGTSLANRTSAVRSELSGREVMIAGSFELGTGLATNGAVLISDIGFARRAPIDPKVDVHLGLIKLKPGIDPNKAAANIRKYLNERDRRSADVVEVLSRQEAIDWEHHHWLAETRLGFIFQLGVILSLIVGCRNCLYGVIQRGSQSAGRVCHIESHGIQSMVCVIDHPPTSLDAGRSWIHSRILYCSSFILVDGGIS